MRSRSPTIWAILTVLALLIGPVQAQNVFACSMMDGAKFLDCCCAEPGTNEVCAETDCDQTSTQPDPGPCCERSVHLTMDEEMRSETPLVQRAEVRSGVDPPPALVPTSYEVLPSLTRSTGRTEFVRPQISHSRSDTYLLTQRLRI